MKGEEIGVLSNEIRNKGMKAEFNKMKKVGVGGGVHKHISKYSLYEAKGGIF